MESAKRLPSLHPLTALIPVADNTAKTSHARRHKLAQTRPKSTRFEHSSTIQDLLMPPKSACAKPSPKFLPNHRTTFRSSTSRTAFRSRWQTLAITFSSWRKYESSSRQELALRTTFSSIKAAAELLDNLG